MNFPTFRQFKIVIIAIMLVVAGASMVFVFYVQRAECLGHGTSIPAVHNEIVYQRPPNESGLHMRWTLPSETRMISISRTSQ